jgi:sec-independent protein translocase protein TatA
MFGRFEELVVVLLIVLVLFGGKQVPKLARAIGDSVREARSGFKGESKETEESHT